MLSLASTMERRNPVVLCNLHPYNALKHFKRFDILWQDAERPHEFWGSH